MSREKVFKAYSQNTFVSIVLVQFYSFFFFKQNRNMQVKVFLATFECSNIILTYIACYKSKNN